MEQLDVGGHACQVPPAQKKLLASVRIYMHRDKITGMKLACKTRLFFIQEKKCINPPYMSLLFILLQSLLSDLEWFSFPTSY